MGSRISGPFMLAIRVPLKRGRIVSPVVSFNMARMEILVVSLNGTILCQVLRPLFQPISDQV